MIALPGFWADVDVAGPNHVPLELPPTIEGTISIVEAVPFKPTVIVYTGGGIQPYPLMSGYADGGCEASGLRYSQSHFESQIYWRTSGVC